ncbi:aliphatic sulfonates family ABC transporter, periplasmic ligand-binding protein [Caldicellulosiruptor kronotskyensis 2002]|uniref:Aliphatic sulfonates family ABC transporter, periplasmic ligand-binding protein n=1 Tax=Caldicellulosiruptor kronotskyensis (strain DSM 18902 / VKM B-2412 / 2002) TaxID=632348 RepID=E4SF47_CALK2|nr:aliphatic sulfonate ABC transporter substrate-binding protein [Caldicellulosiruptor kronotskyensis]ADQ46372.1 aliphatic sulfonates family ABC transporter, periplasmic ligand-binding protein [Caldicellulosiruptor kronotskyensis 2002]
MEIKRYYKVIAFFILPIALLFLLSGCYARKKDKNLKVRIAFFPNITHAQALVGKELGIFQKRIGKDVKVEYKVFNAGPAEIEAFLADEVDIGYIGPIPAINGFAKTNGEIKIIAGATNGGMMLISGQDLNIKNLDDLKGKKIAVPQYGNTQDIVLRFLLSKAGLKDTTKGGDVEIIQAENPDIKTLLDRNQIDAALVPEPWGTRLKKEVNSNVVLDSSQIRQYIDIPTTVIITTTKFLKDHSDIVEKFLIAHLEVTDFIEKNPEKSYEIINNQISEITSKPLPADILKDSFKNIKLSSEIQRESLEKAIESYFELGYLREKPNIEELVNTEILDRIKNKEVY